jgi:hypothetical protein
MIDSLLDPVRHPPDSPVLAAFGGLVVVAGGFWLIRFALRRFGPPHGSLSAGDFALGLPLAAVVFILPSLAYGLVNPDPLSEPLGLAIVQIVAATSAIVLLAANPWAWHEDRTAPDWVLTRRPWILRTLLVWVLTYPVLLAAMFMSVALMGWLSAPMTEQGLLTRIRGDDSVQWIIGWYLLAAVAAPLAEEFVFRVVLYGGIRRGLDSIGRGAPWIAGAISTTAFVIAHEVWTYPVLILPLTALAVILTLCYAHTRSIWPGVLLHGLHNALVVTLQFFVV